MEGTMMVSAAAKAGNSKTGKKILTVVGALVLFLFIFCITIISNLLSIFSEEKDIANTFNAQDTKIYKDIREIYDAYVGEVKAEMDAIEAEIIAKNMATRTVTKYNPETKKMESKEETYCKATVHKSYEYIKTAYVMAYLSCKYEVEYTKLRKINLKKKELIKFWDTIGGIEVDSSGAPTYVIHNPIMEVDEIAEEFFEDDEVKQYLFKESVALIEQFIGVEIFEEPEVIPGGAWIGDKMDIPLYYQYQGIWAGMEYGNGTLSQNGCAPTCIAMVFSYLKEENITPASIINYTKNNYYVNNVGSSWSIFQACADEWGVGCNSIGTTSSSIIKNLEAGKPVILSMGPGTFTKGGHFIVLTGVDEDGNVSVNDPNDNGKKNFANKKFDLDQVVSEAKGGWSFE